MEVMLGPSFTIDTPSSAPSYGVSDSEERAVPSSLFGNGLSFRVGLQPDLFAGESSESSSSIGTPDDSEDENVDVLSKKEEEEEVQSKLKGLISLDSLEDSLPIKRGLSNHFIGKSKSFTDLSQVNSVKEVQKQENPFNKRRRILIASKRSRRSSFYSSSNPKSMPLFPVDEDEDDDESETEQEKPRKVSPSSSYAEKKSKDQLHMRPQSYGAHMRLRLGSFKSRSFSLADLKEHDEEEEENYDD